MSKVHTILRRNSLSEVAAKEICNTFGLPSPIGMNCANRVYHHCKELHFFVVVLDVVANTGVTRSGDVWRESRQKF